MTGRRRQLVWMVLALAVAGGCSSSPTAPQSTTIYAALGASDAVGVGASSSTHGYVYVLSSRLNGAGHGSDLHNLGVIGALADQIAGTPLDQAIAVHPGVVTLWTGSNDVIAGVSPDAFAASLDKIVSTLRSRTSAAVFVADLVDLTRTPRFRSAPDANVTSIRIDAFNLRITDTVAARGAVLVRLSAIALDDSFFSSDGFHPNDKGYSLIADAFWTEMQRVLH
jgi:lysophospholipase L1-like esterase